MRVRLGLVACALLAAACAGRRTGPVVPPAALPPPPAAEAEAPPVEAPEPPLPGTLDEPAEETVLLPEGPVRVRVGLASDLPRAALPCCDPGWVLEAGGESLPLTAPLSVEPDAAVADVAVYRLQVAALRDEAQAADLARRLTARHGLPAEAHFDAGVGLFRVRLGRFARRDDAEAARRRVEGAGLAGTWVVTEGGTLSRPALVVVRADRAVRVPGRWLRVRDLAGRGLPIGEHRYRGDLLVFLNPRGSLNLIGELPVEDYLRGVVPAEMGPNQYGRLEALKAQAVAARTYVLRNLGDFREEGYDICATPRCQAYHGMSAEHPLSDHAIAETADQVLVWRGELVDARYSATCGGHTEDVALVFPQERHEYLKGVPCPEGGVSVVEGSALEGTPLLDAMAPRLGALPAASVAAGDGGRAILRRRLRDEGAFFLGVERTAAGPVVLRLRSAAGERRVALPDGLATFRRRGEGSFATDLALLPGDPLTLWWAGPALAAVVQEVDSAQSPLDRSHPRAAWTRFHGDRELARRIEQRYPGLGFATLEPLDRGVSGRVGAVRLVGRAGRTQVVEGLAVRWTLDLPDTNFTVRRTIQGGSAGYLFTGTGWGHGVGLCQVGSYAMAGRGLGYRDILEHYYTGVELVRVRSRAPLWDEPAPPSAPSAVAR